MSAKRRSTAPFSSILCPVDFSRHAKSALKLAALLAERLGAKLTAVFVNDPLLVAAAAAAYDTRALTSQSQVELDAFVERTLSPGRSGRSVETLALVGEPSREILKAAKKVKADLIVLGSEGLSGARKLFFGSTTARLLTLTDVPVLAVPPDVAIASGWPAARVLAAIDLGPSAAKDVAGAAAIARWFNARLVLVHVIEKAALPRWLSQKAGTIDRDRLVRARARLERLAQAAVPEGIEVHVPVGEPADQIAALATEIKAGVVVLTLRGDDRLFGDRKGATSYRVVCEAGVPVLAVPDGYFKDSGASR